MLASAYRIWIAGIVLAGSPCIAAAPPASSGLALELPDGESVSYTVDFQVHHAGTLVVRAVWSGRRILSLRLTGDGPDAQVARRSGPSPLELEVEVPPESPLPMRWTLQVTAIAGRGAPVVQLEVRLPEAPPPAKPVVAPVAAAAPPRTEPWAVPLSDRVAASPAWDRFRGSAERLRRSVVEAPDVRDTCRWQEEMLRWIGETWDRGPKGRLDPATLDVVADLVTAARAVESMHGSADPLLVGPVPDDPARADAWLQLRSVRVRAIEQDLDRALTRVLRGHASELEAWSWPLRYVSCLTACERYLDEKIRLGDARAANRDLASAQWPRIVMAADTLDALVRAAGDPRTR